jgi:hypothetical protein
MDKISRLTNKVVAFSEVPNFNMDECVDWAIEMISLGYDTPSLLILAGLSKPTNYFETVEYFKKTLNELHLKIKTGNEGVLSYSSYFIEQIALGYNVKENLTAVYKYCQLKNYEKTIYDFYLLYWAWDDFDYGNKCQSYWPDADKQNIESVVISIADKWVKENKKQYAQTIET